MIDEIFDAISEAMPLPLGAADTEMTCGAGDSTLELIHELEEVASIDAAGTWTLVTLRDAVRRVDDMLGLDVEMFEVVEQTIEKWDPDTRQTYSEKIEDDRRQLAMANAPTPTWPPFGRRFSE